MQKKSLIVRKLINITKKSRDEMKFSSFFFLPQTHTFGFAFIFF